jgi:hypothetical protein
MSTDLENITASFGLVRREFRDVHAVVRLKEMEAREKAQREESDKRVKAARRAASINVKSTPVQPAPKTLDDDLRAIANRAYGT